MTLSLVLSLVLTYEPCLPRYTPVPLLSVQGPRYYRDHLEMCQKARKAAENWIATLEWTLTDNPLRLSAQMLDEDRHECRQELSDQRAFVARIERDGTRIRTLKRTRWEFGPSLETDYEIFERVNELHQKYWTTRALAPMPREAKP